MNQVSVSFEIPVTEGRIGGVDALVVDARALHRVLGSARQFTNWIDYKLERLKLVEGVDYQQTSGPNKFVKGSGARAPKNAERNYILSMDGAKHLAMMEGTQQGQAVRCYFLECEKRYLASLRTSAPVPARVSIEDSMRMLLSDTKSTMVLIRSLADRIIENEEALERADALIAEKQAILEEKQAIIEAHKPKIDTLDRIMNSGVTYGFQEASRLLGMAPNALVSRLRENSFLYRTGPKGRNKSYSEYGETGKGYFIERVTSGGFAETRVTPRGLAFFSTVFAQRELALPAPERKALPAPATSEILDMEDLFSFNGSMN